MAQHICVLGCGHTRVEKMDDKGSLGIKIKSGMLIILAKFHDYQQQVTKVASVIIDLNMISIVSIQTMLKFTLLLVIRMYAKCLKKWLHNKSLIKCLYAKCLLKTLDVKCL